MDYQAAYKKLQEEKGALLKDKDYLIQQQADEIERLRRDVKKQQEKMIKLAKRLPHWVSVEDELPPPNKTVLVCKIWGDVNGEPHKVITMDSFTISPSDSVIAWMSLPEPPKEEA